MNKKKIIACVLVLLVLILGGYLWKSLLPKGNQFADFAKECVGEVMWCQTATFGNVPLCKEKDSLAMPSAMYGTSQSLGGYGGWFWNGRSKDQDIQDISQNFADYQKREQEANKVLLSEVQGCIK